VTPVKEIALQNGIALYQPWDIDKDIIQALESHGIDLIVVVAYGKILPEEIIRYPEWGSLNLHASLLPRYRGPSPIEAVLVNGEKTTGITLQIMDKEMDAGDILAQRAIPVEPGMTASDLLEEIIKVSPGFLAESVSKYLSKELHLQKQCEQDATYCPIIKKEDGHINWKEEAQAIVNKIRAYTLWPVAYTTLEGNYLRIFNARLQQPGEPYTAKPGEIVELNKKEGIYVKTGNGLISILELQPVNKRKMDFRQFLNGYRNLKGKVLGN